MRAFIGVINLSKFSLNYSKILRRGLLFTRFSVRASSMTCLNALIVNPQNDQTHSKHPFRTVNFFHKTPHSRCLNSVLNTPLYITSWRVCFCEVAKWMPDWFIFGSKEIEKAVHRYYLKQMIVKYYAQFSMKLPKTARTNKVKTCVTNKCSGKNLTRIFLTDFRKCQQECPTLVKIRFRSGRFSLSQTIYCGTDAFYNRPFLYFLEVQRRRDGWRCS